MENILSKIIKYGLYAVLLTPLFFLPRALYAFLTPKFIVFQVLVEIIFIAWLFLIIYKGRLTKVIVDLRRNYIVLALLGFFAISFISAIFGIDFSRSLWGIGARMTGLFAEFHFIAWFLMLSYLLYNPNKSGDSDSSNFGGLINSNYYLNFSFVVSVAVALTAFYTNLEWHIVPGYTIFSNPTFVAPYFLFHIFWGIYQVWKNQKFNKLFFGIGNILILVALFLGEIRGAIIGLILGVLFLGIGLLFSNIFSRRNRIIIIFCYLLLFLSVITFWHWRNTALVQNIGFLKKFSEISITATTTQTRILLWKTSLKGFFDHPITGVGPENFNYLFNAHYDPQFLKYGGVSFIETWQDKPHNAFLEILSEIGIAGTLSYAAVWLVAGLYLFKMFRSGEKLFSLIFSSAFISYLTSMFFSFDSFGSWFGLYLFLAFLASSGANTRIDANNASVHSYIRIPFMICAIILIIFLLYVNYSIFRANLADADALRIFSRNPAQGIALFEKSLSYYTPYKSEYQFDLVASIAGAVDRGMPLPKLEDTVNFSLDEAYKAVAFHPKDAAKYTDMAKIYNVLGTRGHDPEILVQAEKFGEKSLELSPNRQETLFYMARTALLKNDFKLAVKLTKRAVSIDPEINLSHWYLGLSYIADNKRNEGIAEIKKALELGYVLQNENEKRFVEQLGLKNFGI